MPARVTKRLLRIAGPLLVLLVLAMITGFQPIYWIIYLVIVGTAIGYLWAWIQSRGLETQVQEVSRHPQVGQIVSPQELLFGIQLPGSSSKKDCTRMSTPKAPAGPAPWFVTV